MIRTWYLFLSSSSEPSTDNNLALSQDAVDGSKSSSDPSAAVDFSVVLPGLKSRVIERVEELDMEIETGTDEIAKQALEHIHTNEVILTLGRSRTVERFLKQAAKERKFQVINKRSCYGQPR